MRKFQILAMAALATIFAGCSNNDDEVMQPKDSLKDTPINVNVLLRDIQTRAGYDNTNQPTKFYLSIDQEGENYDYTNVVMKKNENGSWVAYESDAENAAQKQLLWEGSTNTEGIANPVTVTAATFSLSTTTTTPSYSLSALSDQSSADNIKTSDHLYYYSNAVEPSTDGISIAFDHIMSKLEITVTLRDEFEGMTSPITSVIAFGAASSGSFDPTSTTSKWSATTDASSITAFPFVAYNETSRTATYEVILIPQNIAEKTFGVEILVGDKTFRWTSTAAVNFEEGNKYTLALTVGKDKVSGNSFTASAWTSGDDINNKTE